MVTVAGLVPWAVSGVSTLVRVSPWSSWKARVSSTPASSPWEPAEGCSETWGSPAISPSALLEAPHQLQRALGAPGVLERVKLGVAVQRRDALVQLGVVLHRARAQRIEAGVEVEVALGQAVVVAHDLGLGDLGQTSPSALGAAQARGDEIVERALGDVERRRHERAASGLGALIDRQLVVGGSLRGHRAGSHLVSIAACARWPPRRRARRRGGRCRRACASR